MSLYVKATFVIAVFADVKLWLAGLTVPALVMLVLILAGFAMWFASPPTDS